MVKIKRYSIPVLEQKYKDHSIPNPIEDIKNPPSVAYDVLMQPVRNLEITIQVIREADNMVIETITGKADGGSINVSSSSLVRRTCSLSMAIDPDLFPNEKSIMWYGNYVRVYVGLNDYYDKNNRQINFPLGTFWIDEGSYSLSQNGETLDFKLSDKMTKYDDYEFEHNIEIETGTPIGVAMKKIMEHMGETSFGYFDRFTEEMVVPYTLKYAIGDNAIKAIEEIRDMYMDCLAGYNVYGEFEFWKINMQRQADVDEPKWRFNAYENDRADLTIGFDESYNLKEIKNVFTVYGHTNETTGLAPMSEVRITDPNSPFNIDAIGMRKKILIEQNLFTNEQCHAFGRYNAWKMSNFQEKAKITTVPIYMLDANDIIEIVHPHTGEEHKYMVEDFSVDLSVDATMNITANKLYYVTLEYGEAVSKLIDAFEKGIKEYGWLSLAEEKIQKHFGIMGSNDSRISVRFVEHEYGGLQAGVTSYDTTKNQTLLIDLSDFKELDFNDPSGENNRTLGDIADRVLGHEMFHAVVNRYLGHRKSLDLPLWFNEGMAEFIHGGQERFQHTYSDLNKEDKKKEYLRRAQEMFRYDWAGDSFDYSVGYIMVIALYKLLGKNEFKKMIPRLVNKRNININFLEKICPDGMGTNDTIEKQLLNTIDTEWDFIYDNLENGNDTGSIHGYLFNNDEGRELSAFDVFDNSKATVDSHHFEIRIER